MPLYRYKAVTASGDVVEDELEASSQAAAIERLRELGHVPIRADEIKATSPSRWLKRELFGARRVSQRDVGVLTRELATLLSAGVPIDRSLEIAISVTDADAVKELLGQVLDRIRGGSSLADAMSAQDGVFPRFYVSTVQAGEAGGSLDVVLNRLADLMERLRALRDRVTSALIYPTILLAMAGLSIVVLLTVVIPQFTPLFEDAGEALPVSTQIIIAIGEAFERYWWLMTLVIVGAAMFARRQLRQPASRYRMHGWLLRMPLIGDLVRKIEVARFSRTLATLLGNGVALLTALSIVKETSGNAVIAKAIEVLGNSLKEGEGLAELLTKAEVFPSLAIHLVRVGEETGRLEEMLVKVADIYDQEVERTIERLMALLVPALTIALGLLVAAIIMSVLTAMFSVYELPL